jgi:hypothetical protein
MTRSILLNHPAEMALTIGERMPKILIDNPAGDSITGLTSQSASFWDVSIFRHVISNHCDAPFNTARAARAAALLMTSNGSANSAKRNEEKGSGLVV